MNDVSGTGRRLLKLLAVAAFGAALVFMFFGEHRVHVLGYLPLLLLLVCPLLHLAMHGGHGEHRGRGTGPGGKRPPLRSNP